MSRGLRMLHVPECVFKNSQHLYVCTSLCSSVYVCVCERVFVLLYVVLSVPIVANGML